MDILLRVDHREPHHLKQFLGDSAKQKTELLNLAAGDFELVDVSTGKILLLVERKEVEDLCSSLADGRFDSQKSKLSATVDIDTPHPIAYVIEGSYQGHEKENAINTVVLTTRFRDGFFVLRTKNLKDTAKTVLRICELFARGKMVPLSEDELHKRYIASRSAHRGGGQFSNNDEWWTVSLGQIPGIGPQAARTIASKYPTVRSLLDAYHRCKSIKARRELLQDLKPNGSARRLGPKASERVWCCVVGSGDDRRPYASRKSSRPQRPTKKTTVEAPLTECMFVEDSE